MLQSISWKILKTQSNFVKYFLFNFYICRLCNLNFFKFFFKKILHFKSEYNFIFIFKA